MRPEPKEAGTKVDTDKSENLKKEILKSDYSNRIAGKIIEHYTISQDEDF